LAPTDLLAGSDQHRDAADQQQNAWYAIRLHPRGAEQRDAGGEKIDSSQVLYPTVFDY